QSGDFLSAIAQKFYGDGSEQSWRKIYEVNQAVIGPNPTQLQAGMVLVIPGVQSGGSSSSIIDRIIELTNEQRRWAGVAPLQFNTQLTAAAKTHNDLMIRFNQLDHQLPGEPSLAERVSQTGYQWSGVAENIAQGQQTPEEVVASWMQSSPHRANLLNPDYRDIGVAFADNFWTQVFAKSR
ncbi:MAG TPA: CAP domain-containing protein, partial [Allocoleopsis sp.]